MGMVRTLTSRGQSPYSISTIFNMLPEGIIDNVWTEDEEAAFKTVGAGPRTDRQTHRQTHRHDRFYDSCPSLMGNYKKERDPPIYQ